MRRYSCGRPHFLISTEQMFQPQRLSVWDKKGKTNSKTKVLPMVLVGTIPNLERLSGILYPNRTLRWSFNRFFCCHWLFRTDNSRHCCQCLVESNRVNIGPNEVTRIVCLSELLYYSLSLGGTKVVRTKVTIGSNVYRPNCAAIPSQRTAASVNIQPASSPGGTGSR